MSINQLILQLLIDMKLRIGNFQARDLYNTGNLLDKQDPGVKIKIGHNEYVTERKQDAGTSADFLEFFEIEISREEYQSGITVNIILVIH